MFADRAGIKVPSVVDDEHLAYLDELRETGETNMYGAGAYLRSEFDLSRRDASAVLSFWMKTFHARRKLIDERLARAAQKVNEKTETGEPSDDDPPVL